MPWTPDMQVLFAVYTAAICILGLAGWLTSDSLAVAAALQWAEFLWGTCLIVQLLRALVLVLGMRLNGCGSVHNQLVNEYLDQAAKPMLVHLLRPYRDRRHDRRMARRYNLPR